MMTNTEIIDILMKFGIDIISFDMTKMTGIMPNGTKLVQVNGSTGLVREMPITGRHEEYNMPIVGNGREMYFDSIESLEALLIEFNK